MGNTPFLDKLSSTLAADRLLTSLDECTTFATDWTKIPGRAIAVALPRATAEVQNILRLCSEFEVAVVPSGGRTGLAGGAVAKKGELVLSLSRMNHMGPVDAAGRNVRVQAGVTTQAVHEHVAPAELTWPIDLASKGSSTIGGNLSTNAGGVRVVHYGMTRKWVTGLQAVTMQGEVLELNQDLQKNNTGYDLIQLLIGSEGTLAVITEATLRLVRRPQHVMTTLLAVNNLPRMIELFANAIRKTGFDILAFEFFSSRCLETVKQKLNRQCRLSVQSPYYLLVEMEGQDSASLKTNVEDWLEEILGSGFVIDGAIAESSADKKQFWSLREGITESIALSGPVKKYDVSVSVNKMAALIADVESFLSSHNFHFDLYLFGHLGDGSPHFNLLKHSKASAEDFEKDATLFESRLFELLKNCSGSISAEHGVGLLKKDWVTFSRSAAELRLYHSIKDAFDPKGLLNPGKIVDPQK
jgi:FAD/FMN-containing dehydrogenase